MQRSLWSSASRFRNTFPDARFDSGAFARTIARTTRQPSDAVPMIAALLSDLMLEPPVLEMRLAFAHDQLVQALVHLGSDDAERDAADVLTGMLGAAPACGLRVVIAAARRGANVEELGRYDSIIADLHRALELVGARPLGPQEHPVPDTDHAPGNQWDGHLRADCKPHVEHDLLVVLAGRSVGVGEALSTARRMRIPAIVAVLTDTVSPSCRLAPDGDLVSPAITDVADDHLAAIITARVEYTAARARTEQRLRVQRMLESNAYRSYLASHVTVVGISDAMRASLLSPFRFISLSTHEIGHLARELDAFEEADFRVYDALPRLPRDAYDGVTERLGRKVRVDLLRNGSRSILAQAADPRDLRWHDWSNRNTWARLLEKLERT